MMALSIKQPWAWLICNPLLYDAPKRIENRTWSTEFRGRFLVHAGREEDREAVAAIRAIRPEVADLLFDLDFRGGLARGGIVGAARLVRCWRIEELRLFDGGADPWACGPWCFDLLEARPLPFWPCPGRLGFFDLDAPADLARLAAEPAP